VIIVLVNIASFIPKSRLADDSQILKNIIKCEETDINFAISEIKNITNTLKKDFGK